MRMRAIEENLAELSSELIESLIGREGGGGHSIVM